MRREVAIGGQMGTGDEVGRERRGWERAMRLGTGDARAWDLNVGFINYQMKKTMLILAMALLVAGSQLSAQTFQLGIKGGGNLSTFYGATTSNYNEYSFNAGWNAGVFTNFFLGNHFAIAPELLYTTAGAKIKTTTSENNQNVYVNNQLHLAYVSIPVMAKYRFTGGFYLEAGPEVSFNVSNSSWENQSVKSLTNGAEFGVGAGLGYQSPIGLGIGARYNLGLTRVDNVSNANWDDVNLRNSGFQLDLFWTIFNNKKVNEGAHPSADGAAGK
jgi:hypothetical protein